MKAGEHSPLTDIALSSVYELVTQLSKEQLNRVNEALDSFLARTLSYNEASQIIMPILGSIQPLEKLNEVITTPDNPIPYQPNNYAIQNGAGRVKTRAWNPYEDRRLLAGIFKFGTNDWSVISNYVGNGRTKAQCSQRWQRGLDPKIKKTPWTSEQDAKLLRNVELYGDKSWTRIAMEIGDRSDVQCRYRYNQMKKEDNFQDRLEKALTVDISVKNEDSTGPVLQAPYRRPGKGKSQANSNPQVQMVPGVPPNGMYPIFPGHMPIAMYNAPIPNFMAHAPGEVSPVSKRGPKPKIAKEQAALLQQQIQIQQYPQMFGPQMMVPPTMQMMQMINPQMMQFMSAQQQMMNTKPLTPVSQKSNDNEEDYEDEETEEDQIDKPPPDDKPPIANDVKPPIPNIISFEEPMQLSASGSFFQWTGSSNQKQNTNQSWR